jgi:hypothetical protein
MFHDPAIVGSWPALAAHLDGDAILVRWAATEPVLAGLGSVHDLLSVWDEDGADDSRDAVLAALIPAPGRQAVRQSAMSPQKVRKTSSFGRTHSWALNGKYARQRPDPSPVEQGQTPRQRSASTPLPDRRYWGGRRWRAMDPWKRAGSAAPTATSGRSAPFRSRCSADPRSPVPGAVVIASWNLACGGLAQLNRWMRFQSAANPPAAGTAASQRASRGRMSGAGVAERRALLFSECRGPSS